MSLFGEVLYNPTELWVAKLNADNTYATPVLVDQLQKITFQFEADTDALKAYGQVTELLSIVTHGSGTLEQASLDYAAMTAMTGLTAAASGSTPNQASTMDFTTGGAGLPYFGWIGAFAGLLGANVIIGAAKCMLDQYPAFTMDQNKFRMGSAGFRFVSPNTTIRKALRARRYETAVASPASSANFATFFSGIFS